MTAFSQVPHSLMADPDVPFSAIKVYHAIHLLTLGRRPGWNLSNRQIAAYVGIPYGTARDGKRWLIDNGWVIRWKGAVGAPHTYTLCREKNVGYAD